MPQAGRRRKPDWLLVFGVVFLATFAAPGVAYAWGPSVHLWIGETLLETLVAALPLTASLLRRHARSFLYGCLAPDFYTGKGSTYYDGHSHNWEQGRKLREGAWTESEEAFALGYLTHLAADVIGHNHFVPNNLYRYFGVKKFGHVYFEMHADNVLLDTGYADLAHALARRPQHENDVLLRRVNLHERAVVPFAAKKRVFTSWVAFSRSRNWKGVLGRLRGYSRSVLRNDDVHEMAQLSLAHAYEAVRDPRVPVLGRYDPIGEANIRLAGELRRASKRAGSYRPSDVPFPIPAELCAFRPLLLDLEPAERLALGRAPRRELVSELVAV